ncbi:MAG TPA: hypothetical protein VFH88_01220 [Candidatus Krumholzibacteria bacterium]|nr:hypothetical protein [Candidatus Krumholzibacteria bacterium]
MIYYLVTPNYEHTIKNYLAYWAKELEPRFQIRFYDDVLRARELPLGTYIFADLERLLPAETEIAARVWEQLNAAGARLLNHPARTLKRYDLLTMLYQKGRNRFRVVRANDRTAPLNFPVFLREEGEHSGALTVLLKNRHQLDEALVGVTFRRHRLETMLVVEYYSTATKDGIFKKYSSFMVGGRVVPCHVDCSRAWMVKDTDIVDEGVMAEELGYVQNNPHREWLEETFRLAGVDYGRIDYGVPEDGSMPQVWEINTNPVVILTPDHYQEIHMPVKRTFAAHIKPAFEAIDMDGGRMVPIRVEPELIRRLDREQAEQRKFRARRRFMDDLVRSKPVLMVRKVLRPMMTPFAPLLARISRKRASDRSN